MRLGNFRKRTWYKAVATATVASGFDIHDMRHTAISLWIAAGIDVLQVSTFAGHTSVAFTLKQYGHLFPHSGHAVRGQFPVRGFGHEKYALLRVILLEIVSLGFPPLARLFHAEGLPFGDDQHVVMKEPVEQADGR